MLGVGTYGRVGETSETSFDFTQISSYKTGLYYGMYKGTSYTIGRPEQNTSDGVFLSVIRVDGAAKLGFVIASASWGGTYYIKNIWGNTTVAGAWNKIQFT